MNKFDYLCKWLQLHWLFVVMLLTVLWMMFLIIIGFSWIYGYWANALFGTKFEISSCWQGISVVAGAFASIIGIAKAGWEKYKADSEFNTPLGEKEQL